MNIGADTTAKQALDQQLSLVLVDIVIGPGYESFTFIPERRAYITEGIPLSSDNFTDLAAEISGIEHVTKTEVISRMHLSTQLPNTNKTTFFTLVGISDLSKVYEGLPIEVSALAENETYVWIGSEEARRLEVGDVLQFNLSVQFYSAAPQHEPPRGFTEPTIPETINFPINLTVADFVDLSDEAFAIANGQYYQPIGPFLGLGQ